MLPIMKLAARTGFLAASLFAAGAAVAEEHKVATTERELARHDFPYESHYVDVMGSKMHYVDTGGPGDPVVMIHGQPTWSYLWRNIIPHVENSKSGEKRRVIALDLIGFGKSDKPDIDYRAPTHAKYLSGFMDALALDDITLVIHDWGSILGFDYAAKNPDRVKAVAFMEAAVWSGPVEAPYGPPKAELKPRPGAMESFAGIIMQIKTPGVGEKMILEDNFFLEQLVLPGFDNLLTEDEKNAYREPFADGKNRLPMLQFPRDAPFGDGGPQYSVDMIENYGRFLQERADFPKLLLHLSEGFLIDRWSVEWMRRTFKDLTIHDMGPGGHFMQEFNPDGIGQAIDLWMTENGL